jgi:hypothetical protein
MRQSGPIVHKCVEDAVERADDLQLLWAGCMICRHQEMTKSYLFVSHTHQIERRVESEETLLVYMKQSWRKE